MESKTMMNKEYVLEFNALFLFEAMRRHSLDRIIYHVMRIKFDDYTRYQWDESYIMSLHQGGYLQVIMKLTNGREPDRTPGIYDPPEYICDPFSAALAGAFELTQYNVEVDQ